jgi:UDP-3-O-[3-hydroxymyristoyl] glucosamine N-acyltransferase
MNMNFFKKKRKSISLQEIVKLTNSRLSKDVEDTQIEDVKTLKNATNKDLSFCSQSAYIQDFEKSQAGFCFAKEELLDRAPASMVVLLNDNPHYAYTQILNELYIVPIYEIKAGISEKAAVHKSAIIGKNVEIQAGVYVDENVKIGDNCKICANTVINHNCEIGDNCFIGANTTISYAIIGHDVIIKNGARIGQDGFGFAHQKGFNYKIPQLGIVRIGNYAEIGSSTCVDRGAFDDTIIGDNTKLDNLIQIGHGAQIGKGCFLAGCTGIAGSCKIGNFVQIGGHSGVIGHIEIGDGVQIGAHSGVAKSISAMAKYGGCPAVPLMQWKRMQASLTRLGKFNNKDNKK